MAMRPVLVMTVASLIVIGSSLIVRSQIAAGNGDNTEPTTQPFEAALVAQLDELGRIGSVMIDGEECLQIVTDRAEELIFRKDPRDEWAGSDNYDVNPELFMRTKKLLVRLAMLVDFPVDCNLWMKCKKQPDKVHMVIRQFNSWSQFYAWGEMAMDPTTEMKWVLEKGDRVLVQAKPPADHLSLLAPVRDSMGDVVGFLEICVRTERLKQMQNATAK
jgi:hypothetical protein